APVRKPCDVATVVKDAVEFSLRGAGTRAVFDLADSIWPAELDVGQVTQVLSNLTLNARDAMNGDGAITVRAANVHVAPGTLPIDEGAYVHISVEDHGAGIPRHQVEQIFDPYFTTKPGHHGLGLASSHSVVRRHGGLLQVESEPGAGSTFHVYLPAAPGAQVGEAPPPSENYG